MYLKQLFFLICLIFFSCTKKQKFHIDETTSPNDSLTFLKIDMTLLNGIVYGEYGEFGEYKLGKKEGIHKEWYDDGQLKSVEEWKEFKIISKSFYHDNGQLWYKSNDDEYKEYYDNGQIAKTSQKKNGKLFGTHKTFYKSNGELMIEINKEINSMRMWNKNGNLIYEGKYDSNKANDFYYENYY